MLQALYQKENKDSCRLNIKRPWLNIQKLRITYQLVRPVVVEELKKMKLLPFYCPQG